MFYWVKTNKLITWLFPNLIWSIPTNENKIFLTFDDGPTPEITPWVLDVLKQENIKATFFCIGKNIIDNPAIFKRILEEGHLIGNHTYNHFNGWKTDLKTYLENIQECSNAIIKNTAKEILTPENKLFRPPYGKITKRQSKELRSQGYKIIMWDILSADFDIAITPEKCLENATKKVNKGSIIVFHDSEKAFKNLKHTLPRAIAHYKEKGFNFGTLS